MAVSEQEPANWIEVEGQDLPTLLAAVRSEEAKARQVAADAAADRAAAKRASKPRPVRRRPAAPKRDAVMQRAREIDENPEEEEASMRAQALAYLENDMDSSDPTLRQKAYLKVIDLTKPGEDQGPTEIVFYTAALPPDEAVAEPVDEGPLDFSL